MRRAVSRQSCLVGWLDHGFRFACTLPVRLPSMRSVHGGEEAWTKADEHATLLAPIIAIPGTGPYPRAARSAVLGARADALRRGGVDTNVCVLPDDNTDGAYRRASGGLGAPVHAPRDQSCPRCPCACPCPLRVPSLGPFGGVPTGCLRDLPSGPRRPADRRMLRSSSMRCQQRAAFQRRVRQFRCALPEVRGRRFGQPNICAMRGLVLKALLKRPAASAHAPAASLSRALQ